MGQTHAERSFWEQNSQQCIKCSEDNLKSSDYGAICNQILKNLSIDLPVKIRKRNVNSCCRKPRTFFFSEITFFKWLVKRPNLVFSINTDVQFTFALLHGKIKGNVDLG